MRELVGGVGQEWYLEVELTMARDGDREGESSRLLADEVVAINGDYGVFAENHVPRR